MILVGLTGGIGSGKSTVSLMLADRGAIIIDGDAIARALQRAGTAVFAAMVERFGDVVGADGELDRAKIATLVFSDAQALTDLNKIVHPAIGVEMLRRINELKNTDAIAILDFPLLAESPRKGLSGVIVVDVDTQLAVERVVRDRGMKASDVQARIDKQASREDRLAIADFVIDNSGSLEDLVRQVDAAWEWFASLPQAGVDAGETA
ncbi:MAG: dephospho-CoA kinase [Actinobacteria bacterium]|nr:MAG: dephospho-CoA kinase [Actinomycetota bacterium]